MSVSCHEGYSWKLRVGQPVIKCGCPSRIASGNTFILQSFGVEKRKVNNYRATTQLLSSADFIGLNPEGDYESANYSATQYVTQGDEVVFTGQEHGIPSYLPEASMPGVNGFTFS